MDDYMTRCLEAEGSGENSWRGGAGPPVGDFPLFHVESDKTSRKSPPENPSFVSRDPMNRANPFCRRAAGCFAAFVLALSAVLPVFSGDAAVESQQRLLNDIRYLASDELEGRGVGLKGIDLAAEYVRDQFAKAGLKLDAVKGSPYQTFQLHTGAELGPVNS